MKLEILWKYSPCETRWELNSEAMFPDWESAGLRQVSQTQACPHSSRKEPLGRIHRAAMLVSGLKKTYPESLGKPTNANETCGCGLVQRPIVWSEDSRERHLTLTLCQAPAKMIYLGVLFKVSRFSALNVSALKRAFITFLAQSVYHWGGYGGAEDWYGCCFCVCW